jgi:hypothetical protein
MQEMDAECANALRREESTISIYVSSARSQNTSRSIPSLTNIYNGGGNPTWLQLQQLSLRLETAMSSE